MKNLIYATCILLSLNAAATIDQASLTKVVVSEERVQRNRGCFKELEVQGCGSPGDEINQFRSCMHSSFPSLSESCQLLMRKLYGKR